jgi:hypothetical protein
MASMLRARGLYTLFNEFSESPEGALIEAINVIIDRNGIVETRRGFTKYGDTFGTSIDRSKQLLNYKDRILIHYDDKLLYDSDGSGTLAQFNGSYEETETGLRIKSLESNGNFYFTTSNGIKKISATSASDFTTAAGFIEDAGAAKALDATGIVNYTNPGFLTANSQVAYRIVWAKKDNNDILLQGTPSSRTIVVNSSSQTGTVDLEFIIPEEITSSDTEYFYQIYRSALFNLATTPDDELYLVYEDFPTTAELTTTRVINVNDIQPDDLRQNGALLYTNAISGEGITQANDKPPIAKDITGFNETTFYANTKTRQTLSFSLDGVVNLVSGTSELTITDGVTSNDYTFIGQDEIFTFTCDTQANTVDAGYLLAAGPSNLRKYFFWVDKTGSTAEPSAADTAGRIPVKVDISGDTTNIDVADSFVTAIDAITDFGADNAAGTSPIVTVTLAKNGNAEDAANGLTAPAFVSGPTVSQQGDGEGLTGTITTITSGSPTTITSTAHGLTTGETVHILNSDSTPSIDGEHIVTVTGANTFTIPVVTTVGGSAGKWFQNDVLLSSASSVSLQVDETARSLVKMINQNDNSIVYAYYTSGPNDIPGQILLEAREIDQIMFYLNADSTTTGNQFTPPIPTSGTGVSSDNEVRPNRIYYSKYQQTESVPIANFIDVGPKDKEIKRILGLRDSLFIMKEDGVYRLSGINGNFTTALLDKSALIIAPDSAVVLNNQIYVLSNQGVSRISETGVDVLSRPIENLIKQITLPSYAFSTVSFGVSYETDRAYHLWMPSTVGDTTATQCFRFNTFTTTWTRWEMDQTCGIVNSANDQLYLGNGDNNFIDKERKNLDRTDYADQQFDLSFPANAINGTTVELSSVTNVGVGDRLVQTQYLTVFQFNRMLNKLDRDPFVGDTDYFSILEATDGVNFRNQLDNLATKLDNDSGVSDTNYLASLGGGTTFANYQSDFNIIANKLNLDTGVFYTTYYTSSGTIDYEATVISLTKNTNFVTILYETPFIEGPVKSYKGIQTTIQWTPQFFGDPATFKQVNQGTLIFESNLFTTAEISYSSDLSPSFEEIDFTEAGYGTWGGFPWGGQTWGGEGTQVPLRTLVPRQKQRCRFINIQFKHSNAYENYAILGLSLNARPYSLRAYK